MRITADEALQRLQGTGMRKAKGAQTTLLRSIKQTRRERVYVFASGNAIKVCPADDALPAVLAEYEIGDDTPPALNYWLLGYAKEVKWYQETGRKAAKVMKAPAKAAAAPILIEPLLGGIKWGQGTPYNQNLKFGSKYSLTGCVATAMAQVMFYWSKQGRRRGCRATSAYTTKTNKYSVAALPSVDMFNWASMTDAKPTTSTSKAAVAQLMEYMGKAVNMNYSPSISTAYASKIPSAFKNLMNIPAARLELRYTTSAKFKARIIADLQAGMPVIMTGGTSSVDGSHCFVCDGYDSSTGLFHINWGWNGNCDGWFALTALVSDNGDYTAKKNAYLGICPPILGDVNNDGKINMTDVTKAINTQNKGEYDVAADVNFDGKVDREDSQLIIGHILGGNTL